MLLLFLICAGIVALLVASPWLGAESRPDFLNPNKKHGPFLRPFRFR